MNGGQFTPGVEKERPGIYFRFTSAAAARLLVGERGRVALPFILSWGPTKTFVEITEEADFKEKLGMDIDDPSMLLVREAKKRSRTVLAYRLNEGTKAEGSIGTEAKATAKYGGKKGNDIRIVIQENVLDATKKDVTTYVGFELINKQTVANVEELKSNKWVDFSGTGTLTATAGTSLTGGADGSAPTNQDYTDFFALAGTEFFDVIGLPLDAENDLKAAFVSFVKRVRDVQGFKITGVLPNYPGDYEGITNVTVAATLEDKELSVAETVAWVAGASAGATMFQSLTFVEYEGAIDVSPRLDNDEIIERLNAGEFLLTFDPRDKTVSVEQDINSFVSFTTEKNKRFRKNKIIRIIDAINNDLTRELKAMLKERKDRGEDIPANEDGMQIIRTAVTIYFNELQDGGALANFDSKDDIQISLTNDLDGFVIDLGAQPVDAAEKFYFGVEVR